MRKGEELKAPHYASAAAICDYITIYNISPNNRLTPLYFKIYYKKENYLKIKTAVFKYINCSIIKFSILVCWYI